jgi:DNA-directed RNA polymerase
VRIHQTKKKDYEDYSYESHLECYIDGSNNGSQHLSALTRDEITAPHVNLVPLELPGDLYKYVADNVWEHLKDLVRLFDKKDVDAAEKLIDNILELKKAINEAEPRSDRRSELIGKIQALKADNADLMNIAGPLFWLRINDNKHKRKIVKRNTMTLPYGGTPYGLGQQQIDDAKKHGIDLLLYMEHKWGSFLGREVFANCKYSLKRPMQLLSVFEQAGKKAEEEKRFLSWHVPVTNFPVVQNYIEGTTKKFWVQYGPPEGPQLNTGYYVNTFQIAISCLELPVPSKGKQSQGASPNAIHSLDAAHLSMIVAKCPFEITTIHDSFGCLLADMPVLFKIARETFVELYKNDPLTFLMKEIQGDLTDVEFGTLDIEQVLESEYCFC